MLPDMAGLTIELPPQAAQTEFNLRRWAEVLADRELAKHEGRVETDRYGRAVLMEIPAPAHGILQAEIAHLLRTLLRKGKVFAECPISTADGVRAADVAWASPRRFAELGDAVCFPKAPEICVEVLSPDNSKAEMDEKAALYFDAGAEEVWLCARSGAMTFLAAGAGKPLGRSRLCPKFPRQVQGI